MELVSKFMGHADVSTTAANYYVPTALEVHAKMTNPFTGQFQQKVLESEQTKQELELVYAKLNASLTLFQKMHGTFRVAAANGASAAEAIHSFAVLVPDAEEIMRGIVDTTSVSMSVVQEAPGDQAKDSNLAFDADEESSDDEAEEA